MQGFVAHISRLRMVHATVLLILFLVIQCDALQYSVVATRNSQDPLVSSQIPPHVVGHSSFRYNYNTAYMPLLDALLVRSQDSDGTPYGVRASVLALTSRTKPYIENASVVFSSQGQLENYGVEDPRIVWHDNRFWLTYTAAQAYSNGTVIARLALASSSNGKRSSWQRWGAMFGMNDGWSKSGALVFRDSFPPIMIYGDSTVVPGLQLARPRVAGNISAGWISDSGIYFPTRKDSWDSALVEAGPAPMVLSDGNLLWIYNSARAGFASPKPGYSLQYNIGWAILNATDPNLGIIQRCSAPLLSPELPWEKGLPPYLGLTPNVVFANGLMASSSPDSFTLFYGGADSVIGSAEIQVIRQD